MIMTLYTTV